MPASPRKAKKAAKAEFEVKLKLRVLAADAPAAAEQGRRMAAKLRAEKGCVDVTVAGAHDPNAPGRRLTVEVGGHRDGDVELALEQVAKAFAEGYTSGGDRNATGWYRFEVEGEEAATKEGEE